MTNPKVWPKNFNSDTQTQLYVTNIEG